MVVGFEVKFKERFFEARTFQAKTIVLLCKFKTVIDHIYADKTYFTIILF